MSMLVVVPSIGSPSLTDCLDAVLAQSLPPERVVAVLSGPASRRPVPGPVLAIRRDRRLGFAAAVNAALADLPDPTTAVALVNDDVLLDRRWLERLDAALAADPGLGSVQGTLTDGGDPARVDGRGIRFDRWGLPVQVDRGLPGVPEPARAAPLAATSATAALYRRAALDAVRLADGSLLDVAFGSYHEDLDLGLRLGRLGWRASWVPGVPSRHGGSLSGRRLRWRHPWWVLANRWRAVAGNLTAFGVLRALPRLARGEVRAVRTLARSNLRTLPVAGVAAAAIPVIALRALARPTPGPRLDRLPEAWV